ncbi:aquaporin NIP3-3 isoform X2 [Brachypodium distachyon]|uniref:Uncharacterized protein n=1 Tax=Brachypodium distachyon TaxID=15368 RepID=A0A0Q3EID3_BRADI|nr:aquaporin NIP3-3 isoform X2 [Brachypodium distachyon]KQJ86108.1 hypothetical protein BRADI_4g03330v3 [Brachypodium distachyon]|eukprot:XP_003579235.1 aquaporin NIP3-3 isoform X2 [Brachypodium distachyon]
MGSTMIVPMEPMNHEEDANIVTHRFFGRRPKIPANMAAVPLLKKVMAEFLGTFILMFTQVSSIMIMDEVQGLMGIAVSVGLAVTVLVISLVHISGCHMNPAVSITMAVFGHLPPAHLVPYMAAQVLGSTAASFFVCKVIHHRVHPGIATVPGVGVGAAEAFFVEFIVTFILLFVITAVATDPHAVKELLGLAVGATIVMNILVAGPSTGASMNPARTIGPAIVTGRYTKIWVYLVAQPLGALAGMGAYVTIKL